MKKYAFMIAMLALTACANKHTAFTPVSSNTLYFCDDQQQMVLSLADQGAVASILYNEQNLTLTRITDDRDIFSNSIFTLYYDRNNARAALEKEGVPILTGCHLNR